MFPPEVSVKDDVPLICQREPVGAPVIEPTDAAVLWSSYPEHVAAPPPPVKVIEQSICPEEPNCVPVIVMVLRPASQVV